MSTDLFSGVPRKDYRLHFLHLLLFFFSILSLIDGNAHHKDAQQEPDLFYCLHSTHSHPMFLVLPSQVAYQPLSLLWQYTVDLLLQEAWYQYNQHNLIFLIRQAHTALHRNCHYILIIQMEVLVLFVWINLVWRVV